MVFSLMAMPVITVKHSISKTKAIILENGGVFFVAKGAELATNKQGDMSNNPSLRKGSECSGRLILFTC